MMRLDKFLCEAGAGSRSEVKILLKKGLVAVNGKAEKSADMRVNETTDVITLCGERLFYSRFHYYLLHKPAGIITATEDKKERTVLDLLGNVPARNLFPVGRLDKDTEGLLLITDDGKLAHNLLSPKKHVDKTYFVRLKEPITEEVTEILEAGVDIGDDTLTMPAAVKIINDKEIELTIKEGRFHQVKRMLTAVGNEVIYLKRLSMGSLSLPADLEKGQFRPLTEEEIAALKQEKVL